MINLVDYLKPVYNSTNWWGIVYLTGEVMAMDISIDFGSTYSVLSGFRPDYYVPEALEKSGSTAIPSVVLHKNDKV